MTKTFVVVDEMMHQSYPMIMQYVKTEYKEALESFFKDRKEKLTDYLEKYTTPLEIIIDFEREDASILFFSLENSVIREKLISFFGKWIETEGQRILEQQDLIKISKMDKADQIAKKEELFVDIWERFEEYGLMNIWERLYDYDPINFELSSLMKGNLEMQAIKNLMWVMIDQVFSPQYIKMQEEAMELGAGKSSLLHHYRTHTVKEILEQEELGGQYIESLLSQIEEERNLFCNKPNEKYLLKLENLLPEQVENYLLYWDQQKMHSVTKKMQLILPGKKMKCNVNREIKYQFLIMNLDESLTQQLLPYADTPIDGILYVLYSYFEMYYDHKKIMEELSLCDLKEKEKIKLIPVYLTEIGFPYRSYDLSEFRKEDKHYYYQRFNCFWVPGNEIEWPKEEDCFYIALIKDIVSVRSKNKERIKCGLDEQYEELFEHGISNKTF